MKVPTYHKYGLTKAGIKRAELRDQKISDILTHHLTIIIGIILGILIYILNYSKVQPTNFIQIIMQVFLFASMGVLCVGIPAVLFKLAEIFYFKHIRSRSDEIKSIDLYNEEREEFDFWKIRRDYSFWRVLDGLSYEKEIMNIYMHLGFKVIAEEYSDARPNDRVMGHDGRRYYLTFNTAKIISGPEIMKDLLELKKEKSCDAVMIFSQKGFSKQAAEFAASNDIETYDINGLIKLVKSVKS